MEADGPKVGSEDRTGKCKNDERDTSTAVKHRRPCDLMVLFNGLLALFTGLLFIFTIWAFYITEIPEVVIAPAGVEEFGVGKSPTIYVYLSNIGHTDAQSVHYGVAVGLLPYPLSNAEFGSVPVGAGPALTLFLNIPLGASGSLPALSPNQFDAVRDGKHWLMYIAGRSHALNRRDRGAPTDRCALRETSDAVGIPGAKNRRDDCSREPASGPYGGGSRRTDRPPSALDRAGANGRRLVASCLSGCFSTPLAVV